MIRHIHTVLVHPNGERGIAYFTTRNGRVGQALLETPHAIAVATEELRYFAKQLRSSAEPVRRKINKNREPKLRQLIHAHSQPNCEVLAPSWR